MADQQEASTPHHIPRHLKQTIHLAGVGDLSISAIEADEPGLHLTGRQALALLRLLEQHRRTLEQEAQAERDREFGRGPGAHVGEMPRWIKKGDPRLGRQARSEKNGYAQRIEGIVTAVLRYSNGVEQFEITRHVYAHGSPSPGTEVAWVHIDDVELL